jgi:CubicO group peptidase (beta-lactamase class C family)
MNVRAALVAAVLCVVSSGVHAECGTPRDVGDGWPLASPQAQVVDRDALCAAVAAVATPQANLHSVLVVRRGQLLGEWYFAGDDHPNASWFSKRIEFNAAERHDMRSISKSVVSLLVGIARAEDKFPPLDTPVVELFPQHVDLATPQRRAITLAHVLTMTTGQEWNESGSYANPLANSETRMSLASDPVRYVLERPLSETPGTRFNYNGGTTLLLAELLERSTGMPLLAYANAKLFGPLDIRDATWRTDRRDKANPYAGLRLRPRDLAKIGVLLLQKGNWQGRQVVPAAWAQEALQPRVVAHGGMQYGYQWWAGQVLHGGGELTVNVALGNGGQRLFMVPALDLVIVMTAGRYNDFSVAKDAARLLGGVVSSVGASGPAAALAR